MEPDYFYDALVEELTTGPTIVRFTKKDGTYREMLCTRNTDLILQEDLPTRSEVVYNREHIRVWDYEDSGWKSFLYDNCISFEPGVNYKNV